MLWISLQTQILVLVVIPRDSVVVDTDRGGAEEANVKRTKISQEGVDFVVLFSSKFLNVHVSGYKPLLTEPGESTGGGTQATQHIVLKPQLDGDPLLTVGFVNVATRSAKMRSYACMQALHEMRFKNRPFHVTHAQYQSFFERIQHFLQGRGMQLEIEERPALRGPAAAHGRRGPSTMAWLLLMLVALLAGLVAYWIASGQLTL